MYRFLIISFFWPSPANPEKIISIFYVALKSARTAMCCIQNRASKVLSKPYLDNRYFNEMFYMC